MKWKNTNEKPIFDYCTSCDSIANSDTEAYAYVQAAIDAAVRAVGEVTT
jgi:hypothetical protein